MNRCVIIKSTTRCIALAWLCAFMPSVGGGEPNEWGGTACSDAGINKVDIRAKAIIDGETRDAFTIKASLLSFIYTGNRNEHLIENYAVALSSIDKIGPPQTEESYWGRYGAADILWIEDVVRECHRIQAQWHVAHEKAMRALEVLKRRN